MQVTRAAFQAVASLNEQATDPKSHTLVSIAYTLSCPVLSPANSDGRPSALFPCAEVGTVYEIRDRRPGSVIGDLGAVEVFCIK